jgi:hypothetical protein
LRIAFNSVVRGSTVTFRFAPLMSSAMLTLPLTGSPGTIDFGSRLSPQL